MLLLHALLLLSHVACCLSSQISFPSQGDPINGNRQTSVRTTLVDLLSQQEDFSLVIRLLQRAKLIVNLNLIKDATFFAPTNAAIRSDPWLFSLVDTESELPEQAYMNEDNIQARLRQQLLYHCLNYSLEIPTDDSIRSLETLLFPHPEAGLGRPGEDSKPFPGLPAPDQHSLLGGQGQKVRFKLLDQAKARLGVDSHGKSGVRVSCQRIQRASNGVLIPVEGLLKPPESIEEIIKRHPLLRRIPKLYSDDELDTYTTTANMTLFAPTDASWEALDKLEMRYLESGYAQDDLRELFERHVVINKDIGYTERLLQLKQGWSLAYLTLPIFRPNANRFFVVRTLSGSTLALSSDNGSLRVNGSVQAQADIFAANGGLSLFSSNRPHSKSIIRHKASFIS